MSRRVRDGLSWVLWAEPAASLPQQGTAAVLSASLSRSILAAAVASGDKGRGPGSGTGGQNTAHPQGTAKPLTRVAIPDPPGVAGRPRLTPPVLTRRPTCSAHRDTIAGAAGGKGGAGAVPLHDGRPAQDMGTLVQGLLAARVGLGQCPYTTADLLRTWGH